MLPYPQFKCKYIVIDVGSNSQYPAEMRFGITGRRDRQRHGNPPRLVPTGSVDKVLLTGGKNLTLFQSVGLVVIGLGVALGAGVPIIVNELYFESKFARYGYSGSLPDRVIGSAIILWGAVMLFNGLLGIARRIRRRNQV
jgi:hypothetical protein